MKWIDVKEWLPEDCISVLVAKLTNDRVEYYSHNKINQNITIDEQDVKFIEAHYWEINNSWNTNVIDEEESQEIQNVIAWTLLPDFENFEYWNWKKKDK